MQQDLSTQKHEIREELVATRLAFHSLLALIPEDGWDAPTSNPHWTVRESMLHIVLAPELLPRDVALIRRGMGWTPPAWLFNTANVLHTRWRARHATPRAVAQAYDLAHQNVLGLLDRLAPADLALAAQYPALNSGMPGGRTTIADLYHYLTLHFVEHAAALLQGLDHWQKQPSVTKVGAHKPPQGWQRFLFRLPLWLYRHNLGWLLGKRFLLINHLGRKSGRRHHTVVEVMRHDPQEDTYIVASAWGEQADWYQNLRAHPQTTIRVGWRELAVRAEFLASEEAGEEMVRYAQAHPHLAPRLARVAGYEVDGTARGYRTLGEQVFRLLRLRPSAEETSPLLR